MTNAAVGAGSVLAGRYRLLEPLASGGMGTVWRAVDQLLDRQVAIKEVWLPPGLDDEARSMLRRRTMREAQAAARLRHTAIVTVYDVVEQDDRPWIVMELVHSRSLAQVIREDGPLPPSRVASIGLSVLSAMVTAQAGGVQHRDIKPANVLITDEGRVVLTDFGIARHISDDTLTAAGLLLGSPDYLAPERARGRPSPGLAADLWSLGALMYDAVEGRRPFAREGALPTLAAVVMDEPEPPVRAGPLRAVIDGLLVKDPAHRLDAARTQAMLERVVRGRSTGGTMPVPRSEPALPTMPIDPSAFAGGTSRLPETAPPAEAPIDGVADQDESGTTGAAAQGGAGTGSGVGSSAVTPVGPAAAPMPAPAGPAEAVAAVSPSAAPQPAPAEPTPSLGSPEAAQPEPSSRVSPPNETRPEPASDVDSPAGAGPASPSRITSPPSTQPGPASSVDSPAQPKPSSRVSPLPTTRPKPAARVIRPPAAPPEPATRVTPPPAAQPEPATRISPPPAAQPEPVKDRKSRRPAVLAGLLLAALALVTALLLPRALSNDPGGQAAPPAGTSAPTAPTAATAGGTTAPTGGTAATGGSAPSGGAAPTGSTAPTSGPANRTTTPSSAAAATGANVAAPAGFTRYTDPRDGFSVIVPVGWRPIRRDTRVDFDDPASSSFLRIDTSDTPLPDPYQNWIDYERSYRQGKTDYRNLGIRKVPSYRPGSGWLTADWEFIIGGTHVLDRNIRVNSSRAHAIYWSTPSSRWNTAKSKQIFNLAAASFVPAPTGR